jgi:hypothetical protein
MNFPTGVKIAALELLSHVRRPIRYCAYRLRNHVSPLFLLPELIATTNHAQLTSCFLFPTHHPSKNYMHELTKS